METVKVGILGLGTVGSGTINVLKRNADEISRRVGRPIQIVAAAVRDLTKPRACSTEGVSLTDDPFEVVNNPNIDIVVELIGGGGLAYELSVAAIKQGKHVVTANKALIALHGNELFALAAERNVAFAFEAAVAGGIPIIKALREGLSGNRVQRLAGIINGTGNFILTEMREKNRAFEDVLKEAQQLGYAEADPAFDIEGTDAAHKLTILASIAFGIPLQFERVYTEGITEISSEDVIDAERLGYRIKHLGIAKATAHGIDLRVHPTLVPKRQLIANVEGVMNAVLVTSDAVGDTLYYGAGAGDEPTASAVVADIVDLARATAITSENRVPYLAFQQNSLVDIPILDIDKIETAYYLRMTALDQPGVLADITKILGEQGISIEAIEQKESGLNHREVPIMMLTHRVVESSMNAAIRQIEALSSIRGTITRIRMETLES